MSSNKAADAIARTGIAVVPIGALEPHGRHAPLGADMFIANEIAARLATAVDGVLFPGIPLGVMNVLYDFRYLPGTISIEATTLIALYANIGTELARSGVRRLVFVNGHGPNSPLLGIAAYQIRDKTGIQVGILEWWTTSEAEIKKIKGFGFGNHADEIETSLVLATDESDSVDLNDVQINSPTLERLSPKEHALYKSKVFFTRTFDERWIGNHGNMGDPTKATREKGDIIIDRAIEVGIQLVEVLEEQARLPEPRPTVGQK
jgi:creatinine amidohydrolase